MRISANSGNGPRVRSQVPIAALMALALAAPTTAAVIPALDLSERMAAADTIVVAQLAAEQAYWNAEGTAIFTERVFAVEEVLCDARESVHDGQLVLVFWGGTIGTRTQLIPGMPEFEYGIPYLMFAQTSQPRPACPLVGYGQGLIVPLDHPDSGRSLAVDGDGRLVLRTVETRAPTELVPLAAASLKQLNVALTFDEVLALVRERVCAIGCGAAPLAAAAQPCRVLLPAKQPGTARRRGLLEAPRSVLPHRPPATPPPGAGSPIDPRAGRDRAQAAGTLASGGSEPQRDGRYNLVGWAELPIVMNQLPDWLAPWAPNDQYVMSRWNAYASDVFHVLEEPTGTFEWDDGVWDVCGWPTSEQLIDAGYPPWSGETALTWVNLDDGEILEADVAFNPAMLWTLDDEAVWDGSDLAQPFRGIALHEFGHVCGLHHNFNWLCIMNYLPRRWSAFWSPYADDVAGLRANYPTHALPRNDLAAYLFTLQGVWVETTFNPHELNAGQNLAVHDVWVENVGTTTSVPTLNWYVSPTRNLTGLSQWIGLTSYGALAPLAYTIVDPLLTVPASVPPGSYYIGVATTADDISWNSLMFTRESLLIRPANNACNAPLPLSLGYTPFTTLHATTDFTDDCPLGADIWYTLLPPCTGSLILNLCNSDYDTCVAVYAGWNCPPDAPPLACNDDSCGSQSYLELDVTGGAPYLVRVGGYGSATGSGAIEAELTPSSGNDSCYSSILVGEGSYPFSTSCATTDGNPDCYPLGQDIWFDYNATCSGPLTISLCGSGYDTMLAVYEGYFCPPAVLPLVACDDDACGLSSEVQIEAVAGQRYLIRVGGYNQATGSGTLTIQRGPANNLCADALWVNEGTFPFTSRCATTDGPLESATCGEYATPGADLWFCYQATQSGWATARVCDLDFDSVLAVYLGCNCPGAPDTALVCDDDGCRPGSQLSFWVDAGTLRLIRVGGYSDQTGDGVLEILCGECGVDEDCDDGNSCTADHCDTPDCVHTPINADCDDGDPCTVADSCINGECMGQPVGCSLVWLGACLLGPDLGVPGDCVCLDGDWDADVDLHDYAAAQVECVSP